MPRPVTPAQDRFWRYVDKTETCWVWTASQTPHGYGQFNAGDNRITRAHQFAYVLLVGPVPQGLELDHLCRNRLCVNPAHLEPVTHAENLRRAVRAAPRGQMTHCRKGHALAGANLYESPDGGRHCRTCRRERMRPYLRAYRAAKS